MKLGELLKKVDITEIHADLETEITSVYTDTRKKPDDRALFVAVRGYEHDGHAHIDEAIDGGAVCILCETAPERDVPYVLCADSRRARSAVSANFFSRPADGLKIIGVTGTKGKSTVTHLIKYVIEQQTGRPVGLIGTLYCRIGETVIETDSVTLTTPDSFDLHKLFAQMRDAGCEYVVMEVSSIALELDRVADVVFEVALCTNVTQDHLDYHGDMETYAAAKSKIFRQARFAVINGDDPYSELMRNAADCPVFTYSSDNLKSELVSKRIKLMPSKVEFSALTHGNLQQVELEMPGMFSVYNAMSAVAVCINLGFDIESVAEALARCPSVLGRVEVVPDTDDFTVLIDYAHTPDSLKRIIEAIRGGTNGRVVTLFGCGGDRDRTKRPLMGKIAVDLSDQVYLTSDNPRTEDPDEIIGEIYAGMGETATPVTIITDRKAAIFTAVANAKPGDTLILAGKGHEMYHIVGREKFPFDEREIVADALRLRRQNG